MTVNPQTHTQGYQQKDQPNVRAANPDSNRQFSQQNKPGIDPSKQKVRPEDDEERGNASTVNRGADTGDDSKKY